MNTVKELKIDNISNNFSPKKLPEIIKYARNVSDKEAFITCTSDKKPFLFETNRIIKGRFKST